MAMKRVMMALGCAAVTMFAGAKDAKRGKWR